MTLGGSDFPKTMAKMAEIRKHLHAARARTRGVLNVTWATDKANVGGPSMLNTVMVLANGDAILLPPQVSPASLQPYGPNSLWESRRITET